ncbi:MAG: GAF domain-containing protein [Betaproteobacteria bacterium]|nr:GAF domain-containing protein [Betaproteobacteria bacterium]
MLHAFDWRRAFVVLSEPDGRLNGLCAVGLTREEQQRLQFQTNEGIVGRVFTNGIQVLVPDVRVEPLFLNRTGGSDQTPGVPVAMLVTPIRADRSTIGVLAVDCLNPEEKRGFANDLQLLKMVATLMGQAVLYTARCRWPTTTCTARCGVCKKGLSGQASSCHRWWARPPPCRRCLPRCTR